MTPNHAMFNLNFFQAVRDAAVAFTQVYFGDVLRVDQFALLVARFRITNRWNQARNCTVPKRMVCGNAEQRRFWCETVIGARLHCR